MELHSILAIIKQTLIITIFVLGMMMVIEYINVSTKGVLSKRLQKSPWIQIIIGALMGAIPGCLGSFTMVSLYVHRVVSFPALVTTMIATSGDEAFFMFSLFPREALILTITLFVISIVVGIVLQCTMKNKFIGLSAEGNFPLHGDECGCHHKNDKHHHSLSNKYLSPTRLALLGSCLLIIILILTGILDGSHELNDLMGGSAAELHEHIHGGDCEHGHHHEHHGIDEADWIRVSLLVIFGFLIFVTVTAKEHFLQEHLWGHVVKVHLLKIFLWSFAVILGLTIINNYIDVQSWISNNLFITLILALLLGIIPQSGPNLIFVILFAQGSLPISILLASSAVQNGHGSLPLLAESSKAFAINKAINILVGLAIGICGIVFHF